MISNACKSRSTMTMIIVKGAQHLIMVDKESTDCRWRVYAYDAWQRVAALLHAQMLIMLDSCWSLPLWPRLSLSLSLSISRSHSLSSSHSRIPIGISKFGEFRLLLKSRWFQLRPKPYSNWIMPNYPSRRWEKKPELSRTTIASNKLA